MDQQRFVLRASHMGDVWRTIADRSKAKSASPHTYVQFDPPIFARYIKLENVFTPAGGKFAVNELRLFGVGGSMPPDAATDLTARRDASDRRKIQLS